MQAPPFISICIPAYRRKENLKRLLDSIEMQNFQFFEVVITDDSPDNELQQMIENHSLSGKIRYYKNQVALGSPENWNQGIRLATADWIKIMHDDDWFAEADSLQSFATAIEKGSHSFYFSAYTNIHSDGRADIKTINLKRQELLARFPEILFVSNYIGPPSAVIFKKLGSNLFDYRMKWLVDIDFYIRYIKENGPASYIPQSLVRIGIDQSQITRSSFGNPEIEIPERFMLNEKLDKKSIRNISIFDSWWRFLRNLGIHDLSYIKTSGYMGEIPAFISPMINFQGKVPGTLLRFGLVSKLFMFSCYLKMRGQL